MRGGFVHNEALIGRLERKAIELGLQVRTEAAAGKGVAAGFIDLVVRGGFGVVAIEAERTPRRVEKDIAKARSLGAAELWLLVPSVRVGRAIRASLSTQPFAERPAVYVLLLSQAEQRLTHLQRLFSASNPSREINPSSSLPAPKEAFRCA